MHVLFVSACEKRAIKKTRAVLDSFAIRTGEKTWATPITDEGLREVRTALKRVATRQTAVACYRNEGRLRMKLLWIVGSRNAFGFDGHFPVGHRVAKTLKPIPEWLRVASLLAQAGGWGHDFGKASQMFQAKLRAEGPMKDSVRHEWVSMRLLQLQRDGKTWDEAWQLLTSSTRLKHNALERGLHSATDVLDFLIVTHHRLLGPEKGMTQPNENNHFSGAPITLSPQGSLSGKPFETVRALVSRIEKLTPDKSSHYWRAIAIYARAALIMADHVVSARPYGRKAEADLFANTKSGQPDQPLEWHLGEVAHTASDFAYRIGTMRLPGLSEQTVEAICRPAGHVRFQWQDRTAEVLTSFRQRSDVPVLALNMACTGSGKTRMNARAACLLAQGSIRFAVALNLRTLTLQTGDAYREQLHIGEDELACIIGDRVTQQLHRQKLASDDADENEAETEFDVTPGEFDIPAWLEEFAAHKRNFQTITGAPILISTIDFLIAAGMPHKQGHHVAALLRLIDSDLVLDEVDGYDPKPLVAVLRLVQISALFGRNVICSTATLAEPIAHSVYQSYLSGAQLRAALYGNEPAFACALFDDVTVPEILLCNTKSEQKFKSSYRKHIERQQQRALRGAERVPYLQAVTERSVENWQQAVLNAIRRLHDGHGWLHQTSSKRVSFGLVRMANIRQAIATARFIAESQPNARVACYHSQDFLMQRFLKEKNLDRLLRRQAGNTAIEIDPEIKEILVNTPYDEVIFIVVATPVEEIGRDHDFDWAVIEPSSTRSIVQTAGRVNRHRHIVVSSPNIAILQFNHRWARGEKIGFCHPGYEIDNSHDSHDLAELLNWPLPCIDAGLMFNGHKFADLDNASIANTLKTPLSRQFDLSTVTPWWITQALYEDYRLRERETQAEYYLDPDRGFRLRDDKTPDGWLNRDSSFKTNPGVKNAWLAYDHKALFEFCEEFDLSPDKGMRFSVRGDNVIYDQSFGFYTEKKSA
jgi:CRISPR-associated endonuclease/helicase Cas3